MTEHINIWVSGRVQGVWFRKYVKQTALDFDLKGYVSNLEDGKVYIEAEGESEKLSQLLDWLWTGSPMSRVEDVKHESAPSVGFDNFEIRR